MSQITAAIAADVSSWDEVTFGHNNKVSSSCLAAMVH
jgi:hypothetical protein